MRTGFERSTSLVQARAGEVQGAPPPKYSACWLAPEAGWGAFTPRGLHMLEGGSTHPTRSSMAQHRCRKEARQDHECEGCSGLTRLVILHTRQTSRGTCSEQRGAQWRSAAMPTTHLHASLVLCSDLVHRHGSGEEQRSDGCCCCCRRGVCLPSPLRVQSPPDHQRAVVSNHRVSPTLQGLARTVAEGSGDPGASKASSRAAKCESSDVALGGWIKSQDDRNSVEE
jgi:hypothetical protein